MVLRVQSQRRLRVASAATGVRQRRQRFHKVAPARRGLQFNPRAVYANTLATPTLALNRRGSTRDSVHL